MTQYFSTNVSIALTLLATVMWGSWMQVVKHKDNYPISGIIFWLYTFSLLLIGTITIILAPTLLEDTILNITKNNIKVVGEILLGGALMAGGLFFSLVLMNKIGLLLATTVSGTVGSILGIITSITKEGIPNKPNAIGFIVVMTIIFICAGLISSYASFSRDKDYGGDSKQGTVSLKIVLMAIVSAMLTNGWSIGTATGTSNNFPPILTCFYMALGSFLSTFIVCSIVFTKKKQWKQILCLGDYPKKPLLLGVIAAVCHYGGNLISIYSMPALSATLSFLFGRMGGLVTIGWGLYYGEFKGSSKKTKIILALSIATYLLGLGLLGYYAYS